MEKILIFLLIMSTACLQAPTRQTSIQSFDLPPTADIGDQNQDAAWEHEADEENLTEVTESETSDPYFPDQSNNEPEADFGTIDSPPADEGTDSVDSNKQDSQLDPNDPNDLNAAETDNTVFDTAPEISTIGDVEELVAENIVNTDLDNGDLSTDVAEEATSAEDIPLLQPCLTNESLCDDNNYCTDDWCDETSGCVHANNTVFCDDGDLCTENDTCVEAVCQGTILHCNDGDSCTVDSCATGVGCVHSWICECHPGDSCDDSNICTTDSCVEGFCQNTPNSLACDDYNACTTDDTCSEGECHGNILNCHDGNLCTDDKCEIAIGCVWTFNNASCSDSNACTIADTCQEGICTGQPRSCDDTNPCTDDGCNTQTGCFHLSNTASCDDGDVCTLVDFCSEGQCRGKAPADCSDNNACTLDICHKTAGCLHSKLTGTPCDEGDVCTAEDFCQDGVCTPGNEICECRENADCVDDGDKCNGLPFCNKDIWPYRCETDPTTPVVCDSSANTACLNNICQPQTGKCEMAAVNEGLGCDDGKSCNILDKCLNGACSGSPFFTNDFDSGSLPQEWQIIPSPSSIWQITSDKGYTSTPFALVYDCSYSSPVQIFSPPFLLPPNNGAILRLDRKAEYCASPIGHLVLEIKLLDEQNNDTLVFKTDQKNPGWTPVAVPLDQFSGNYRLKLELSCTCGENSYERIDSINLGCN